MLHQQFLPMAEQNRLRFECDIAPNVPDTFISDELRLNQILRNLLVNAFKFTENGSVKLIVRPEMGTAAADNGAQGIRLIRMWNSVSWGVPGPVKRPIAVQRISFTVTDTGIGIDPEKQQMIFEAFQQEDGAINRKYGGTGLGLSISLQLARLLGGTLALKSVKGQGSSFTLHVPVKPDAGTVAAAGGTESLIGHPKK
jgi:two-component system chemotaxis sensor kinase CheA